MENLYIRTVLDYYTKVVFEGDIVKIINIAKAAKALELENEAKDRLNQKMATPNIHPSNTTHDVMNKYLDFDSSTSRCAVPLAMVLFSTINFFGHIFQKFVGTNAPDFPKLLMAFMKKSDVELHHTERTLLSSTYRNGIMHGFFPRGSNILIELDPDDESKTCFIKKGSEITLSVMALYNIVKPVIYAAKSNHAEYPTMQLNLEHWANNSEGQKVEKEIEELKKHYLKKDLKV